MDELINMKTAVDEAVGGCDRAWDFCVNGSRPLITKGWWIKQCTAHADSQLEEGFSRPKNAKVASVLPRSVAVPLVQKKLASMTKREIASLEFIMEELRHVHSVVE